MTVHRVNVKELLDFYGAKNENDLLKIMAKDAERLPCVICHKEFSINQIYFVNGDPVCWKHKRYNDGKN